MDCSYGIDMYYYVYYLFDSSNFTMSYLDIIGNEIRNCSNDGIYIYYDIYLYGNSNTTIGRALVKDNLVDNCSNIGIYIYSYLYNTTGASIELGNAIITNNTVSDNGHGIYLDSSSNCTITFNKIINNTNHGMGDTGLHLTSGSNDSEIYWNCFIDNDYQAYDDGERNSWHDNYWSDYPVEGGVYNITGSASSQDIYTLGECPLGQQPMQPSALVPAMTPFGIVMLVGLMALFAVAEIRRRKH